MTVNFGHIVDKLCYNGYMTNKHRKITLKFKTGYIYALVYGNEIMYIGQTTKPDKRLQQHKRNFKSKNIRMIILEQTHDLHNRESYYIKLFSNLGCILVNVQHNKTVATPVITCYN